MIVATKLTVHYVSQTGGPAFFAVSSRTLMNDAGFDGVRGRGDYVPLCAPCCQMGKTAVNVWWVLREQPVNDTPVVALLKTRFV
jgi:hypothetical protein